MGDFVFIAAILLLVVLGPCVLAWRTNSTRRRERAEDQEQWRELTSRTYALEQTVRTLQAQRSSSAAAEDIPRTSEHPLATPSAPPFPTSGVISPPPTPPVLDSTPSVRAAEKWVTRDTSELATPFSSAADRATPLGSMPVAPLTQPSFTIEEPPPSLADRLKSSLDIEEMLGTNWLNKLGIVILVLNSV